MMTEEEAREKWCPFGRIPWFDGPKEAEPRYVVMASVNRSPVSITGVTSEPNICRCIASQCMAWRWQDSRAPELVRNDAPAARKERGWCGLAGKPE